MKYCSESALRRTDQGAIYSYMKVSVPVYSYIQDLPDTLLILRRTDQGAILIHMQVNIALYGYTQDLPDTSLLLRRTDKAFQRRPGRRQ